MRMRAVVVERPGVLKTTDKDYPEIETVLDTFANLNLFNTRKGGANGRTRILVRC